MWILPKEWMIYCRSIIWWTNGTAEIFQKRSVPWYAKRATAVSISHQNCLMGITTPLRTNRIGRWMRKLRKLSEKYLNCMCIMQWEQSRSHCSCRLKNVSEWNTTRKYEKGLRLLLRIFICGTAERLLPFLSVRNTSVIRSIFAHRLLLTRIRLWSTTKVTRSRFFLTRTLQLSVVNCFRWHRTDVKRRYVTRQDRISIFLVITYIVWTVTQECTAEDVGQKVKMLFIAMSVQLTGKAKGVTFMVFLRNILKPRSYGKFREWFIRQMPILMNSTRPFRNVLRRSLTTVKRLF